MNLSYFIIQTFPSFCCGGTTATTTTCCGMYKVRLRRFVFAPRDVLDGNGSLSAIHHPVDIVIIFLMMHCFQLVVILCSLKLNVLGLLQLQEVLTNTSRSGAALRLIEGSSSKYLKTQAFRTIIQLN